MCACARVSHIAVHFISPGRVLMSNGSRSCILFFVLIMLLIFASGPGVAQAGPHVSETSVAVVGSGPFAAGGTLQVTDTASNAGSGTSGTTTTYLYLATSPTATTGSYLGSRNIASLAGGSNSTVTTTFTLPTGISGTYYVIAENNAASSTWVASSGISVGGPNVSETSVAVVGSGPFAAGGTLQVTDTASNAGSGTSGTTTTYLYLATSPTATTGSYLGSRNIASLAGGSNSTVTTTFTLPTGISGTYYVIAENNAASSTWVA